MRFYLLLFVFLATAAGNTMAQQPATHPAYNTYCNARFGYCIGYPSALLIPQPESENGDGRRFFNDRNESILIVWGRLDLDENGDRISLLQQFNNDLNALKSSGCVISYRKTGKTFYVISGRRKNGQVFYQKTVALPDAFAFALLAYSPAEKNSYDSLAGLVFRTFR